MAPYSITNHTLARVAPTTSRHSLLHTSSHFESRTPLAARTATPIGPSTQSSTSVDAASTSNSLADDLLPSSPRTYIGVGPAIVSDTPHLVVSNATPSGATSPPMPARYGFIGLVGIIFVLLGIVGILWWRRTKGKKQDKAVPPARPRQKKSETARAMMAAEDPPPSIVSNLPRDIIRAMNAAPGSSTPSGVEEHEYPPDTAKPSRSSNPPYTYFSTDMHGPLPVLEITSPVSSAASSPGPLTPTFEISPLNSRSSCDADDRFSWDFKCKGKHCSISSTVSASSSGLTNNLGGGLSSRVSSEQVTITVANHGTTASVPSETAETGELGHVNVRGEVFDLVADGSLKDLANSLMDITPASYYSEHSSPLENDQIYKDASVLSNTSNNSLHLGLGLDGNDTIPQEDFTSFSKTPDKPPKLDHIVTIDSFSLDIDFEPFRIQVVQSRPASASGNKVRHGTEEQFDTSGLESELQKVLSARKNLFSPSNQDSVDSDVEQVKEFKKTKIRPVLSTPNHRTLSPTSSSLKLRCSKSTPVLTPKLDRVAASQLSPKLPEAANNMIDEFPLVPAITNTHHKKGSLRSSISLPSTVTVRMPTSKGSLRRRTLQKDVPREAF